MQKLKLREADKLEVTILEDNYTDLLSLQDTDVLKRPRIPPPNSLLAAHGLSCLIKVYADSEIYTVLMDAGISETSLLHNMAILGIDPTTIESIVLSHGHFDHFGGLVGILERTKQEIPLVLHPEAFLQRRLNIPRREKPVNMPTLSEQNLKETGASLNKSKKPSTVASDLILISGEVERVTDFEKGFPWAEAKIEDNWSLDPFNDDQGIAVKVKDRGLVVIGGCSHAGIINTVKYLTKIAQTESVHAVLGGFHLTGPAFESVIAPTIEEMKNISPDFIVPMHCTGWKAINQFAKEMSREFFLNTVGTTYVFQ